MERVLKFSGRFSRRMFWLAALVGLITAAALPCTFLFMGYQDRIFYATLRGEFLTQILQRAVAENPDYWVYDIARFVETAHGLPQDGNLAALRVYGKDGQLVYEHKHQHQPTYSIAVRTPVKFLGQTAGSLEIVENMEPLLQKTALAALFFGLLGLAFFVLLYRYPRNIIETAERDVLSTLEQLQASQNVLREMTVKDAKTHLFNASYMQQRLEEELETLERSGGSLWLLLLDIDYFRKINELFGRTAGDALLKELAALLSEHARAGDILARIGGEDFILAMPGVDGETAETIAQTLRTAVENHEFAIAGKGAGYGITVSIGLADWRAGATAEQLIAEADTAMHAAKEAGRNQVCIYTGGVFSMDGAKIKRLQDMAFSSDSIKEIIAKFDSDIGRRILSTEVTMLVSFLKVMLMRESDTADHCRLVNKISLMIGKQCGLSPKEMLQLNWGSILHDLGMLAVSDAVLLKTDKLTPQEYATLKKHPTIGYELLKNNDYIGDGSKVVLHHHERWDGTGYPDGLVAERIPLLARICAIADSIAAMAADRPYRLGLKKEAIVRELRGNAGRQFDPLLVTVAELAVAELFGNSDVYRPARGGEGVVPYKR